MRKWWWGVAKVASGAIVAGLVVVQDPLDLGKMTGLVNPHEHWVLGQSAMRDLFLLFGFVWLFVWYHRVRVKYEERLSEQTHQSLVDHKLKRLRADGEARVRYAKEVAEVPKSEGDLKMGDHHENKGTVFGNVGPTTNFIGKR